MEVNCPNCGTENWLENQRRCIACEAILRRCADCSNFDQPHGTCTALATDVDSYESEHPRLLSLSTNCFSYRSAKPFRYAA